MGVWQFAPDSRRIYFVTADTVDLDEKLRREKRFTVDIRNMETPLSSLWALDMEPVRTTRLRPWNAPSVWSPPSRVCVVANIGGSKASTPWSECGLLLAAMRVAWPG